MCRLLDTNKYRKPKAETIIAYKVFCAVNAPSDDRIYNYCGDDTFQIGTNVWDSERAKHKGYGDQDGF